MTPNQVVGPPLSRPFRSGVSLKGKMLTNADSGLFRDDSHVTVFLNLQHDSRGFPILTGM